MAVQYKVVLEKGAGDTRETEYLWVHASDDKSGYAKARKRALAKLEKQGKTGFRTVAVNAVG